GARRQAMQSLGEVLFGRLDQERGLQRTRGAFSLLEEIRDALVRCSEALRVGEACKVGTGADAGLDLLERRLQGDDGVDDAAIEFLAQLVAVPLVDEISDLLDGAGLERNVLEAFEGELQDRFEI